MSSKTNPPSQENDGTTPPPSRVSTRRNGTRRSSTATGSAQNSSLIGDASPAPSCDGQSRARRRRTTGPNRFRNIPTEEATVPVQTPPVLEPNYAQWDYELNWDIPPSASVGGFPKIAPDGTLGARGDPAVDIHQHTYLPLPPRPSGW